MKKKILMVSILTLILLLTGCKGKTKLSGEDFKNKLEEDNYVVEELNSENISNVKKVYVATYNGEYEIMYSEYVDKADAKDVFKEKREAYNSCNIRLNTTVSNYETYRCTTGDDYISITRVDETIVFTKTNKNNKKKVEETYKKIGY